MTQRIGAAAATAGLALLLLACEPTGFASGNAAGTAREAPAEAASGEAAAEVSGKTITVGELDAWIKDDLFRRETRDGHAAKLFELRTKALGRLLEDRILETEAARRGVRPDEVLSLETQALGEVTDEEVTGFYEENRDTLEGQSLEDNRDSIREFLKVRRRQQAMARLAERANVKFHLERPRFEVAATGPARGPAGAPVTIVEFSDFQCPYCGRALPIIDEVLAKYPGQVRLVYRHLPLESIHPRARAAAEASACAHDQDKFWPYHDKLFANRRALGDADLQRYAQDVGLDADRFEQCVAERKFQTQVDTDLAAARAIGVSSTPTFVVNGVMVAGAKPVEEFSKLIDAEIAKLDPGEG